MTRSMASTWWLPLLLAGLSLVGTTYVTMTNTDVDNGRRISVLEAHEEDTGNRLERIENKLDRLIEWTNQQRR